MLIPIVTNCAESVFLTVLPHVVRCVHPHQIWDEIHNYVFVHTNSKSRQLRSELKSIAKRERSISKYFARVQQIVDILESVDDPISHRDQLEASLMGYLMSIMPLPQSFSIVQLCFL